MKQLVWFLVVIATAFTALSQGLTHDEKVQQEVEAFERELSEALAHHDRTALERLIADGFIFIHSTGNVETRKQYVENAAAGNLARQRDEVERTDEPLRIYEGHTAVRVSRRTFSTEGANTQNRGRHVDVYEKIAGRWQWISGQSTKLPLRPTGSVNASLLVDSYLGLYEIRPGRNYTVSKESKTMVGEVTGRPKHELIAKSATEFAIFSEDVDFGDDRIVFLKDREGHVTDAVYWSEGREVWRAEESKIRTKRHPRLSD